MGISGKGWKVTFSLKPRIPMRGVVSLSCMGVLHMDMSSLEGFIARVVELGEFGLDTVAGEVFTKRRVGRRVCRCGSLMPVAVYQRPPAWPRAGGQSLAWVYWLRGVRLCKRGRE